MRFNLDAGAGTVDEVLILAGDHIYKMDYGPLLRFHRDRDADVTMASCSVPYHQAHRFGMVGADPTGRVIEYEEKPKRTHNTMASMGIYVFKARCCSTGCAGLGGSTISAATSLPGPRAGREGLRLPLPGLLGRRGHDPGVL